MDDKLPKYLLREDLQLLLDSLHAQGYQVHGPVPRDGAIAFDQVSSISQLPQGWEDDQQPGKYRLSKASSQRVFNWANGPQALKPLLNPPRNVLWQAKRQPDGSLQFYTPQENLEKIAVLGVKACDLAAMKLQDQHFMAGEYPDPAYSARRAGLFVVAVNCSRAASTCFCASTGDGPEVESGYDLALTELDEGYLIEIGSEAGASIIETLPLKDPSRLMLQQQQHQAEEVINSQVRALSIIEKGALDSQRGHPQWEDIAERCLACGNCTMVCPTCFCHHQVDETGIAGADSQHVREWDSCFGESHGQLAGFQVRDSVKLRYQQWMIHKLDAWQEQYGRSGCTGCGRCLSWCPAEIDFVAEANLIAKEG